MNLEEQIASIYNAAELGQPVQSVQDANGNVTVEPVRMGATGMDLQIPLRNMPPKREAQSLEQTKKDFLPSLTGLAGGTAVGTAEGVDLVIGLFEGAYKAAFPDADQTRFQGFLDGVVNQFETGYGEGARQMLLNMGEKAGYDEEQLNVMDEAITAGSFFGAGGAAKAAVQKGVPLVRAGASKAGDVIEGAGDAAKARMADADSSFTAGMGVDPDPAIAAAGDAVKAMRGGVEAPELNASLKPPTETEPGVIAFHGSGSDFDEFKLEKIGTGEGAQAYGYGLYFTDSEDIAKFYRDTISRRQGGIPQSVPDNPENIAENLALDINFNEGVFGDTKQLQINSANPDYDFYIQTLDDNAVETTQSGALKTFEFRDGSIINLFDETVPVFNGKALDSVYTSDVEDVFGAEIADIAQRAKDMGVPGTLEELTDDVTTVLSQLGQGLSSKRDMSMAVESLAPSGQGAPSRFKTIYNHFIQPKSTIETTSTVTELGAKKGKMYKVAIEPKPEDMLDYQATFADQPKKVQDALKAVGYQVEKNLVGQKNPKSQIDLAMRRPMPMVLDSLKGRIIDDIKMGKIEPGKADKILSEKLLEQGVPGIKYRASGSRAASVDAADAEMNYVVFDDKMIKILEKYGIVGPVAIGAATASQQEGEVDDAGA